MKIMLAKERRMYEEMVGIQDDNTILDIEDLKNQIKHMQHVLPNFRKKCRFLSLA